MSAPAQPDVIDLGPHPRLLGVLGDIEFQPWQCIAELIDNAFDEFLRHPSLPDGSCESTGVAEEPDRRGSVDLTWGDRRIEIHFEPETPTVTVYLPGKNSTPQDGEVWVKDNGPGMSLDVLNNALRAGWTSNGRYGRLGLFGVGFNIATARLGHVTHVRTARAEDPFWTVVTIDLRKMAASGNFSAPVSTEPKASPHEHGTEVVIRQLKAEHHGTLSRGQAKLRGVLGDVYSYLLSERGFRLIVDREIVKPRLACTWAETRTVVRGGDKIPAVIRIDEQLPDRNACLDCGAWQDDTDAECRDCKSTRLEVRQRRIWGWVGIQRYLHKTEFGIDFLRNGRKVLLRDQRLFNWEDPDDPSVGGDREYPIEVPPMGRIVGEIHIDHVRVSYQKDAFEYDTPEWKRVVRTLRGEGPLQPKKARALGYQQANSSPLARLFNGYRRNDPGLGYLIPGDGKRALHEAARDWAERFRKGEADYQTDEKWYLAAQQHDNPPAPPEEPIPDPDDILRVKGLLPPPDLTWPATTPPPPPAVETEDDRRARWRSHGHRLPDLEAKFGLPGHGQALDVKAWIVHGQTLHRPDSVERLPVYIGADKGPKVEVFVDGNHPVFTEFAVDTRDLVVIELAEYLRVREGSVGRSLSALFYELKEKCLPDHKIGGPWLGDTAETLLSRLRETMQSVVVANAVGYWDLTTGADQAAAQQRFAVEAGGGSWDDIVESAEWIQFVPAMALARLVTARPDAFLDQKVFRSAYTTLLDPIARSSAAERVVDLIEDVAVLVDRRARRNTEELQRGRLSCRLLEQELTTATRQDALS